MPFVSLLSPLLLLLLLLLHLVLIYCRSSPSCLSPSPCGHITIKYPFVLYEPQTKNSFETKINSSYCGYPGLLTSCKNNKTAILHLQSNNYTILSIDYNKNLINLVDSDVLNTANSCPIVKHNVSFASYDWIYYTNLDVNLIFLFDCHFSSQTFTPITCLPENTYVIMETDPYKFYYSSKCQENVVAPVLNDNIRNGSSDALDLLLENGFQLRWDKGQSGCNKCEKSGGRCGYNLTSDSLFVETCLCEAGKCGTDTGTQTGIDTGTQIGTNTGKKKSSLKRVIIGASIGACGLLAVFTFSFLLFRRNRRKLWLTKAGERNKTLNIEATLENCVMFTPNRYNFYEIRKTTKSLSEKLGQGGYGEVFKGKLVDGTLVAVKVFKDRKGNGEAFTNEVASIARTSHVNIVRLLGFSMKGSKRALIYEFMPNGSLDKYLGASENPIMTLVDSTRLYEIGIGIARGLEYLHRGCNTRIIHFDIKPHNILLDQDYCPKISDFGLAKFCRPKESNISMSGMRGTIGYIAPEVFSRNFGTISSKSDVYSYGMMVLEMIGGKQRKASEIIENSSRDVYFPDNIYKCVVENIFSSVYGLSDVNEEIAKKMAIVGLWCIQLLPDARPTMSRVLEMLEGSIDNLSVPPKSCVSLAPELVIDSFSTEL